MKKIENELKKDWCAGSSILGGEPLEPENLQAVKDIASLTKAYGKECALWTGYYMQDLNKQQLEALENVNIVIDGPFVESLKDLSLVFKRLVQSASLEKRQRRDLVHELRPNALGRERFL